MLMVEGVSDGGDGGTVGFGSPLQGQYWWIPVAISMLALLVSLFVPVLNILLAKRSARRQSVRDALSSVLTPEVVRARVEVGKVARDEYEFVHPSYIVSTDEQRLATKLEYRDFIDDLRASSFTMMWAIQALVPVLRPHVERQLTLSSTRPFISFERRIADTETETLLRHVEMMSMDLEAALDGWGVMFKWHGLAQMTNEALSTLPGMLGYPDRDVPQLTLPPTDEEYDKTTAWLEAKQSRDYEEGARKVEAEKAAAREAETERWEEHRRKWRPRVSQPRNLSPEEPQDSQ